MNQYFIERETAIDALRAHRETRETSNPYHRVTYAGREANRFQILRSTRGGKLVPFGSYPSLQTALIARDGLPAEMRPRETFAYQEDK
ncbi:MAG TPA: hypothetical protein VHX60_02970 [Acidobacteriaceae bacterium]|jgi:hypothetical protein|nr:hypothetical protein [Acidobacteriaceae bacterium]